VKAEPELGAGLLELLFDEGAQLMLKLGRDVLTPQLFGEVDRVSVGIDEGETPGAIIKAVLVVIR